MSCPSSIALSMYADGELSAREITLLELHAASCAACAARIEALQRESAVLRLALRHVEDEAPIPSFVPPPRTRDFVVLVLGILLIAGFSRTFWSTIDAAIPDALGWLNLLESGELFERALNLVRFIVSEGAAMWSSALNFVGATLVLAFIAWLSFTAARQRGFATIAVSLLAVVIALPSIGHALEIRHDEQTVTVPAGETIDDSLIAGAPTITIDGNVNGDLLAFGQSVTVRGNVTGNLVTAAQRVTIEGTVGGSVLGAAENLSLANLRIGRDLYGFGNSLDLAATANVAGNATTFGKNVGVGGGVGVDLHGFAETLRIGGSIGDDVVARGARVSLLPSARVMGDLTSHVDSEDDVEITQGAIVSGNVDTQIVEREQRRNRYATVGYYFGQVVRVGAMFLAGLLLFALFPVLRDVSLPDPIAILRSGGIGLAAAVTLPVVGVLLCITLIGIPLGLLTFVLGAIGLYFSKIVMAQIIGRTVLRRPDGVPAHYALMLLTGLAIVVVAINLPSVGGIANFVLTLVGFGIIVTLLYARVTRGAA